MNDQNQSESVRIIEVEFVQKRPYWWSVCRKPKWPNGHPEYPKTCEQCGTAFIATRYEQRFCTASCAATHNERKKGNRPKLKHVCAVCSKEFLRYDPPSAQGIMPKYCSRECQKVSFTAAPTIPTTSENIDFKKLRAKLKQREYNHRYNQTEAGKESKRAGARRAYLKRKARNEQGKIN